MRTSICLVLLVLCLVALIEKSDAKKKPSKGKGKGKGKPSKGNEGNGEQPTEETVPVVEKCKSEFIVPFLNCNIQTFPTQRSEL